jgi:aryl carrier-like protein
LISWQAQVVGIPDPIAGELPVAVIGSKTPFSAADLRKAALQSLGPAFVPNQFITLEELGLDEFPKTMSGKIQKMKLAAIVKHYLTTKHQDGSVKESRLLTIVKDLWSKNLGIPIDKLDINASLAEVADSISAMRFQSSLRKQTGKTVTIEQLVENNTISSQVKLLEGMPEERKKSLTATSSRRSGPLTTNHMLHTVENPGLFDITRTAIEEILRPMGLNWNDVEDVFPAYDNGQVSFQNRRTSSWSYRFPVHTNASKAVSNTLIIATYSY